MIRLELTHTEGEILRTVLSSYLSDLRMEIADTDSLDFREQLKKTKGVLAAIVERLEAGGIEQGR